MANLDSYNIEHTLKKYKVLARERNISEYNGLVLTSNKPKLFRNQLVTGIDKPLRVIVVWQPNFGLDPQKRYYCYLPYFGNTKHEIIFGEKDKIRLHTAIKSIYLPSKLQNSKTGKANIMYTGLVITDDKDKVLYASLIQIFVWTGKTGVNSNNDYYRDENYLSPFANKKKREFKEVDEDSFDPDEDTSSDKEEIKVKTPRKKKLPTSLVVEEITDTVILSDNESKTKEQKTMIKEEENKYLESKKLPDELKITIEYEIDEYSILI